MFPPQNDGLLCTKTAAPCLASAAAYARARAGETKTLTHGEFVERMLAMTPEEAGREAAALLERLNFVSTYGFSKVLTEQLLNEPDALPGVAKVIVRPSLISNTAYGPYAGYLGGFAGSPGYSIGARRGCGHGHHGGHGLLAGRMHSEAGRWC